MLASLLAAQPDEHFRPAAICPCIVTIRTAAPVAVGVFDVTTNFEVGDTYTWTLLDQAIGGAAVVRKAKAWPE